MNPVSRNLGLWLLLLLMGLILWSIVSKQQPRAPEITFTRFMHGATTSTILRLAFPIPFSCPLNFP